MMQPIRMRVEGRRAIAPLLVAASCVCMAAPVVAQGPDCVERVFYNGKIVTMDSEGRVGRSVTIQGDRIVAVGVAAGVPKHSPSAQLIDLKGRTVIPGLIDSHNHIVVTSSRPGHDIRIDLPASIAELQDLIRKKAASLAAGEWITSVGGWGPEQFAERRMPTVAELDAASPRNPVYLQTGFDGPAVTNGAGRLFFEQRGIKVAESGTIDANAPTDNAYSALVSLQTAADRRRGALEMMAYAASLGLTMSDDKGGSWPADTPGAKGFAEIGNRTNTLNPFTGYNQFLALDREGRMSMRLRIFFYMQDTTAELPFLKARLNNEFQDFGDAWLKISGIGERIYSGPFPFTPGSSPDIYLSAARLIAEKGWTYDEHGMGIADEKEFVSAWEKIDKEIPLAPLHWCLAHVPGIDSETVQRLKALGVGVSAAGGRYTATTPPRNTPKDIPPFRMLAESGIHVGYGSDGGTVTALNPWVHLYYMVTGKNSAGQEVAPGQTLSRLQALRLYTSSQPWFTKEEADLGSIEQGKLADFVVLSDDYLDPARVPDEAIKHISSVLTVVGGKVVHDSGVLRLPLASPSR